MKQKIIIGMQLNSDKCRRKALTIAAEAQGVNSVSLEGDQLTVTGDMDVVCLARKLGKKFCCVNLVSVEEVKKKDKVEKGKIEDKEVCYFTPYPPPPPCIVPCPSYCVVYDPYPDNCSIM